MTRDWPNTLLPASYNGVAFHVEAEDRGGGRRLAVHETSGGEISVIEDMGAVTGDVSVTAYLAGDVADFQANALIAAVNQAGPGMLVLPIDGMILAYPQDFRRSREKDRNGYVAVDLTFLLPGGVAGPVLSLGNVLAVFSVGVAAAGISLSVMF